MVIILREKNSYCLKVEWIINVYFFLWGNDFNSLFSSVWKWYILFNFKGIRWKLVDYNVLY